MPPAPPVVLTIAGFDPSSGAGVTADIKTIAAHGCYGVACITALTVQSTSGVRRVEPVSPDLVIETLRELTSDIEVAAVLTRRNRAQSLRCDRLRWGYGRTRVGRQYKAAALRRYAFASRYLPKLSPRRCYADDSRE